MTQPSHQGTDVVDRTRQARSGKTRPNNAGDAEETGRTSDERSGYAAMVSEMRFV